MVPDLDMPYAIPVLSCYKSRDFPIVGTSLDFFEFRDLRLRTGRLFGVVGECVIGSNVARQLDIQQGDSLISSPESFFDFAGVYPLKMDIVGVMGLGHGHQDLAKVMTLPLFWIAPTALLPRALNYLCKTRLAMSTWRVSISMEIQKISLFLP